MKKEVEAARIWGTDRMHGSSESLDLKRGPVCHRDLIGLLNGIYISSPHPNAFSVVIFNKRQQLHRAALYRSVTAEFIFVLHTKIAPIKAITL